MGRRVFQSILVLIFGAALFVGVLRMPKPSVEPRRITTITVAKSKDAALIDYQLLTEKELLVLAYDGDKEASYQLGVRYDYGVGGTEQSFSKALSWYQAADAANQPKAACALGYLYLNGCGVTQNINVAEQYFNRAVAFSDMEGYVGLGRVELARDPVDGEKALDLFNEANRAGIVDGIYFVGYLAEKGIGLPEPNYARALALYRRILDRYDTDDKLDVPDTYAFDNACVRLGIMYAEGAGVEKNYGTAREYFTRAANNGYAMAQYYMGIVYESGRGVSKNYDEALRWFNMAADQDYAPAVNQIGYMYFVGEGVDANFEQAVYYQKLAAALGSVKAQVNLGYLYENGYGVVQDFDSALTYYRMAEKSGYEGAPEAILRVTSLRDPEEADVVIQTEELP